MKRFFFPTIFPILLLVLPTVSAWATGSGAASGAPNNPTAYAALRAVQKAVGGNVLERVVEVSGRDGGPQPYLWRVILREANGSTREVAVAGGKLSTQRPAPGRPAPGPGTLRLQDLNLDSSGAFDAAEAQARKVRVRFDSLNYLLQIGDNGKPSWTLELFNQDGNSIGKMRLAANDGTVASINGRLSTAPGSASTVTPLPPTSTHLTSTTTGIEQHPVAPLSPPPRPVTTNVTTEYHSTSTTTNTVRDDGEGGFFTRAGRTLDHTNHRVAQGVGDTNNSVKRSFKRTGATIQRFFVGHSDLDRE